MMLKKRVLVAALAAGFMAQAPALSLAQAQAALSPAITQLVEASKKGKELTAKEAEEALSKLSIDDRIQLLGILANRLQEQQRQLSVVAGANKVSTGATYALVGGTGIAELLMGTGAIIWLHEGVQGHSAASREGAQMLVRGAVLFGVLGAGVAITGTVMYVTGRELKGLQDQVDRSLANVNALRANIENAKKLGLQ